MSELGRLARVELRTVWTDEARDFTPWLAQDENIAVLGETLGMELEVDAREKSVGAFRADVLCHDANRPDRESWILIENQLERTDHVHLGQLLTYAAGLHAVTAIWISQRFADEHRAVLDWLNEITGEQYQFFGLEVELWKIGDSPAAPKFNIVSRPNEWSREIVAAKQSAAGDSLRQATYRRYWTDFVDHMQQSPLLGNRQPGPRSYLDFAIGRSGFWLTASLRIREQRISVHLGIGEEPEACLHLLQQDREKIEVAIGQELQWRQLPKTSQLLLVNPKQAILEDSADWEWQHKWLAETLEEFDRVLRPLIADLDPSDWIPDDVRATEIASS